MTQGENMLAILRAAVTKAGGVRAYARKISVSPAHISDVLNGSREPGPKVLEPLGLEKRVNREVRYYPGGMVGGVPKFNRVNTAYVESMSYGVRCNECGEYETACKCEG